MHCPCCISEINDEALVCPVCRRDLYLFKPLMERIDVLEKQVAARDEVLVHLQGVAVDPENAIVAAQEEEEQAVMPGRAEWLRNWLVPLVLLLLAHGLIVVIYDLNTLYLRLVSLLIPLPFGVLIVSRARCPIWLLTVLVASLAGLAVFGMSALNALVDGTPILPVGMREWREFFEYSTSIGLSYVTGVIIGGMSRRRARAQRMAGLSVALAHLVSNGAEKTEKFQVVVKRFNDLGGALMAAATTAIAIYSGLLGVIAR